jgi:hypothetical protein
LSLSLRVLQDQDHEWEEEECQSSRPRLGDLRLPILVQFILVVVTRHLLLGHGNCLPHHGLEEMTVIVIVIVRVIMRMFGMR